MRAELLFALAARDLRGQRLDPTAVRQSVAVLAGHRIAAIAAVQLGALPTRATANVDALLRETFRVVAAAFDRFRGVDPATRPKPWVSWPERASRHTKTPPSTSGRVFHAADGPLDDPPVRKPRPAYLRGVSPAARVTAIRADGAKGAPHQQR